MISTAAAWQSRLSSARHDRDAGGGRFGGNLTRADDIGRADDFRSAFPARLKVVNYWARVAGSAIVIKSDCPLLIAGGATLTMLSSCFPSCFLSVAQSLCHDRYCYCFGFGSKEENVVCDEKNEFMWSVSPVAALYYREKLWYDFPSLYPLTSYCYMYLPTTGR